MIDYVENIRKCILIIIPYMHPLFGYCDFLHQNTYSKSLNEITFWYIDILFLYTKIPEFNVSVKT